MAEVAQGWELRGQPPVLFRRFAFKRYGEIRAFLDALAALAEETGLHPQNINFGTTYVNITLEPGYGALLGDAEYAFAERVNGLYPGEGG